MIIGVDAGCLGVSDERLKVGVYRFALELLSALFKLDRQNYYRLYSFFPIDKNLMKSFGNRVENQLVTPAKGWLKFWLPLELLRRPVDVFLGLSQSLPFLPLKLKKIVLVYDLTFEKNPQWFKNSYQKMSVNTRKAVVQADQIIAISQATKKDIIDYYQVPAEKIEVIYGGINNFLFELASRSKKDELLKLGITEPYFLFVGTLKQSKNVPNIIRAFLLFLKEKPNFQLVLVGSNYWLDEEIKRVLPKNKFKNKIKLVGFVPDSLLANLYKKAVAFVSPSFNEGFGLTYLEAALFTLPIITSNNGAIPEILGEAAFYVDSNNPQSICLGMLKVCKKPALVQEKRNLMEKIKKKFSWEKSAFQLYKKIIRLKS